MPPAVGFSRNIQIPSRSSRSLCSPRHHLVIIRLRKFAIGLLCGSKGRNDVYSDRQEAKTCLQPSPARVTTVTTGFTSEKREMSSLLSPCSFDTASVLPRSVKSLSPKVRLSKAPAREQRELDGVSKGSFCFLRFPTKPAPRRCGRCYMRILHHKPLQCQCRFREPPGTKVGSSNCVT